MPQLSRSQIDRHCLSASKAFAAALRGEPCHVRGPSGVDVKIATPRWAAAANAADHEVLDRCSGATVDIGCGPGRMTHALMMRGVSALGIDVVAEAVAQTRARGGSALHRNVFETLPGEGCWETALLADGNIGIGGDPVKLLRRVNALLKPAGRVVVDLSEPGTPIRVHRLRLVVAGVASSPFPWAVVPADQLALLAEAASMRVLELVNHHGRWFAALQKNGRLR